LNSPEGQGNRGAVARRRWALFAAAVVAAVIGALAGVRALARARTIQLFGEIVPRVSTSERRVALTFDDGPNPDATPRILDTLRAEGVAATFFLLGKHVDRWPGLAARVADEGHGVGNHGYHHRKLHACGPGYVRLDLELGTDSIVRATGTKPAYFRAPHGFRSPWVSGIARGLGQRTVGWTLGVWDSARPGDAEITRRAVDGARNGTILLLHDGDGYDPGGDRRQTAAALPRIIAELRARGFRFVTLPT